jgi:CheY-like chemotaxis protein
VLLVEDSQSDTALTAETLKEAGIGIELYCVDTGEAALAFLRGEGDHQGVPRPKVVLLDLGLPGMSGMEVLQTIRDDDELRSIPVIVQTGSQADRDVAESFGLGAREFITKPLDIAEFMRIVEYVTETT